MPHFVSKDHCYSGGQLIVKKLGPVQPRSEPQGRAKSPSSIQTTRGGKSRVPELPRPTFTDLPTGLLPCPLNYFPT